MSNFKNKTAIISGGAEGIGFGIAEALAKQGMNIVLGDIDIKQLQVAEQKLSDADVPVLTMQMDVTDRAQWQALADAAINRFGKVHMLVNNAGVASAPGPVEATNYDDWRWVMDVNLMGVLKGTEAIVPLIKQHDEGGWLLNVASMAGMAGVPYAGAYTATKVAVVGMSESWRGELASFGIHTAVLCPEFVKTRIHLSARNRQTDYRDQSGPSPDGLAPGENPAQALVDNGISPSLVGERVVEALNEGEFYIFTHPNHRDGVNQRAKEIDQAFVRAAQSPLLKDLLDAPIATLASTTKS